MKKKTGVNIRVGDKYFVTSDPLQFVLNEIKVIQKGDNAGQERIEVIGFYPTLSQLISGMIHHEIRTSTVSSFEELKEKVDSISQLCENAFVEKN